MLHVILSTAFTLLVHTTPSVGYLTLNTPAVQGGSVFTEQVIQPATESPLQGSSVPLQGDSTDLQPALGYLVFNMYRVVLQ